MNNKFDLEQYLFDKAKQNGYPVRAVLELSPICNFNCNFCYIRHSHKEAKALGGIKSVDFWKKLIPQMKKIGVLIVTLIGGEPFLYDGFHELYTELVNNGFLVNITTNGSLIDDELIQLLSDNPPRYVTVSLYGASNETYKLVTGNAEGFSKTIDGIEKLLNAGIPVKLNYVLSEYNKNDLDAVYKIKEQYNVPLLADAYCFPALRKATRVESKRLSPKECAKYHMLIKKMDSAEDYHLFCKKLSERTYNRIEGLHKEHFTCYAGSAVFWVSWLGNMIPCGFLDPLSISLDSENIESAWQQLKEIVRNIHTSEKCSKCDNREICHVCSAAMYCESGNFEKSPSYLCEMTDEIINIANLE